MRNNLFWRRYVFGLLILFIVVIIWVSANFLMKFIFEDNNFERPFFLTYISSMSFNVYLIGISIQFLYRKASSGASFPNGTLDDCTRSLSVENDAPLADTSQTSSDKSLQIVDEKAEKLDFRSLVILSLKFSIIWFFANYFNNASLVLTNVASSTILSSTSSFWTLIIGSVAGVEKFSFVRLICVVLSLIGVILVSLAKVNDADKVQNDWRGDLIAILGAVFYGLYIVLLKKKAGNEQSFSMPLFLGLVGLFNAFLLWPLFFVLDFLGIEQLILPNNLKLWGFILLNSLVGTCLSELLWMLSMLMTTPLVATMGLSLTIPLAIFGDVVGKHLNLPADYWVGAILVVIGFIFVNLAGIYTDLDRKIDERIMGLLNSFAIKLGLSTFGNSNNNSVPSSDYAPLKEDFHEIPSDQD